MRPRRRSLAPFIGLQFFPMGRACPECGEELITEVTIHLQADAESILQLIEHAGSVHGRSTWPLWLRLCMPAAGLAERRQVPGMMNVSVLQRRCLPSLGQVSKPCWPMPESDEFWVA